jgi:hypothetical protein
MPKLKATTLPVSHISPAQRDRMFAILEKYYEHVSRPQFDLDLNGKDAVILLLDARDDQIQGFSTLKKLLISREGLPSVRTLYSGDTVVEREYWGQKILGVAFLRYLWSEKLKHPFQPLYWFLISKGYKTYLLMANNFKTHYPRYEEATPESTKKLLHQIASSYFGDRYSSIDGLIRFQKSMGQLKGGVADISEQELERNARIRFFTEKNPEWQQGTELACLAEMTFLLPVEYACKRLIKVTLAPVVRAISSWIPAPARTPALVRSAGSIFLKIALLLKTGGGR